MLQTTLFTDNIHIMIHSKTAKAFTAAAFHLSVSNIFLWVKEQPNSHLVFNVFYDGGY